MWTFLEENHLFARSHEEQTLDQEREVTVQRINRIIDREFVSLADVSVFNKTKKKFIFQANPFLL